LIPRVSVTPASLNDLKDSLWGITLHRAQSAGAIRG